MYAFVHSMSPTPWGKAMRFLIGFKVDLPSALGILITYQDNDGD